MRHRAMNLFSIVCLLVSIAVAGAAASAPFQSPITALVGKTQGPLNLRYDPSKSGPVSGDIFGDRIEGYWTIHPGGKHTLAFLQFKRNASGVDVATNVYTADYDPAQSSWMGASYALDVPLGGASALNNATPFRTTGPFSSNCIRNPACAAQNNRPHKPMRPVQNPAVIAAAPTAGFPVNVGSQQGSLVLHAATGGNSDGVLTGTIFGDTLTGHYARHAGTIVFLRIRKGRPIQVFTGTLDLGSTAPGAIPGAVKGGDGYPLAANNGGRFSWRVTTNDQLVSGLRSTYVRNRCLASPGPAAGAGGALTTTLACSNNDNVSWVVSAVGVEQGSTLYAFVSVATGLCLQMPGTQGNAVVQQVCDGSRRQSLVIDEVEQTGIDKFGVPVYRFNRLNTTAAFAGAPNALNLYAPNPNGSACLAMTGSGDVVEFSCDEKHPKGGEVPNDKAGWTHNP